MTVCEFLLNSSPLHLSFHHKSKILAVEPWSWWWRQQELQHCLCSNCSPFIISLLKTAAFTVTTMIALDFPNHAFNFYDFLHWFVTVSYFQLHEIYLLTWWVHILNSVSIKLKYQWSYWTESKGTVSVCTLWTICAYVKCSSWIRFFAQFFRTKTLI